MYTVKHYRPTVINPTYYDVIGLYDKYHVCTLILCFSIVNITQLQFVSVVWVAFQVKLKMTHR